MMTILDLCKNVIAVSVVREASYVTKAPKDYGFYSKTFGEATLEVVGDDCPEFALINFLSVSGEGVDYAREYVANSEKGF
jgi:hypothetical protein